MNKIFKVNLDVELTIVAETEEEAKSKAQEQIEELDVFEDIEVYGLKEQPNNTTCIDCRKGPIDPDMIRCEDCFEKVKIP